MPESTCLHIQDRPAGPIRVVEIPWMTVRIGRAAYCEVRLTEAGLADEVCRLQRRGRTWNLVPLSLKGGPILVQDLSVAGPHPLPFDVPFRIGTCCFTLRQNRAAEPDWRMYEAPSPAARTWPTAVATATVVPIAARQPKAMAIDTTPPVEVVVEPSSLPLDLAEAGPPPYPPPLGGEGLKKILSPIGGEGLKTFPSPPVGQGGENTPLEAATSPVPPPTRPTSARVNPWEARWKAAEARLSSAAIVTPKKVARPGPLHAADRYPGVPLREPSINRPIPRPSEPPVPPASRGFSAEPTTSEVPGYPSPPPRPATFERPPRFEAVPNETSRIDWLNRTRPTPPFEPAIGPLERPKPAPISAAEPAVAGVSALVEAWEFPLPAADEEPAQVECLEVDDEPEPAPPSEPTCQLKGVEAPPVPDEVEPEPSTNVAPGPDLHHEEPAWAPIWFAEPAHRFTLDTSGYGPLALSSLPPESEVYAPEPPGRETSGGERAGASSNVRGATLLDRGATREWDRDRRIPADDRAWPVDPGARAWTRTESPREHSGFNLPSAKEILAAAPRRPAQPAQPAKRQARTSWDRATPTLAREPAHWDVPLWLAWPPAALLVLAVGVGGFLLTLRWAGETYDASVVAQRLFTRTSPSDKLKALPESIVAPEPSWWQTTAQHLAQWGVYLGRLPAEEDRGEEARRMLEEAVKISPINPTARLAREQLVTEAERSASPTRALGLSRDAASLAWTARTLRQAGKNAAAIRLYREALRIAGTPDPATVPDPVFDNDPAARRYLLPGEAATASVVRELFGDQARTFREWSEAVPESTIARLATARLFREQRRPEAEALIARIIEDGQGGPAASPELAIRQAAAAEAQALLSHWAEAEERYRTAIEGMDESVVKRSWWFNLASIAHRLDDETQRQAALQEALDAPASDDISRRAIEFQRASEHLARPRPGATKAN